MTNRELTPSDWQIEQFRCTAFLQPQSTVTAHEVFVTIADTEPVARSENRQQAMSSSSGKLEDVKINVVQVPARLDVLFQSAEEPGASNSAEIGQYVDRKDALISRVTRWLDQEPHVQRLAMGVVAVVQVVDRPEGYRMLQKLLPSVMLDPEHSSDFNYQINRPRLVNVADEFRIKINRLSKWGVAASIFQTFTFHGGEAAIASQPVLLRHACRAELDLSSDQETAGLPPPHLTHLWNTFSSLADELISKGDVP